MWHIRDYPAGRLGTTPDVIVFLLGGLIAWAGLIVLALAMCRAAAHADVVLMAPRHRRCETRFRRAEHDELRAFARRA